MQLIAPVRDTPAVKVDKYGYQGEQFQYPFPLSETEFLVTFSTEGSTTVNVRPEDIIVSKRVMASLQMCFAILMSIRR